MIWLLVFYLVLAGIGLSFYHSYRVIRRGGEPGALVDSILEARREKRILLVSGGASLGFAAWVLFCSLMDWIAPAWVVVTPFLYLVCWSLPRLVRR